MVNPFYWRELDCKSLQGYLKPRLNKLPKKKKTFKIFKGCLPQILLGPYLNTSSYICTQTFRNRRFFGPNIYLPQYCIY